MMKKCWIKAGKLRDLPPKAKRNRIETGMEKVKGFF
jgi:hypothetical protein